MGVRRNFAGECNVDILLILFRLLTLQCKRMFTKRFAVSTPQRKWPTEARAPFEAILKSFSSGAVYEICHKGVLSSVTDFAEWRIFTQLSLKWNWTNNEYVCHSLIRLSWLNRTHFWNLLTELFSTLRLSERFFLFINFLMSIFWEHFLQISHDLRTINHQINISGEKTWKLDTLAKLFQTMRNGSVSWHNYRTSY